MINDKFGFTVVRCYKIVAIDDKSNIAYQNIYNADGGNTYANYNTNEEDM